MKEMIKLFDPPMFLVDLTIKILQSQMYRNLNYQNVRKEKFDIS